MHQRLAPILFFVAVIGIAVSLAIFVNLRNQWMWSRMPAVAEPVSNKAAQATQPVNIGNVTSTLSELTATKCAQSGGKWNECGSLCRGKKSGTVCAEVCVPQCECITAGKSCPDGYACISEIASGEGTCRVRAVSGGSVSANAFFPKELRSADGVTSVSVEGMGNTGVYPPAILNPFNFSGTSTAFENVISWNVKQGDGKILASGFANVDSPDIGLPGKYEVKGFFDAIPTMSSGTLNVFEASAKDGSPIHSVSVPVILNTQKAKVTVFWNNSKRDPEMLDCSKVFPVVHEVAMYSIKIGPTEVAVHELLKGPTKWEKSQGFSTSLPEGVDMPKFMVANDGRTILDFDESLQQGVGGSCRVAAIRSQIERTWEKSLDSTETPMISIDGRTEDILQP